MPIEYVVAVILIDLISVVGERHCVLVKPEIDARSPVSFTRDPLLHSPVYDSGASNSTLCVTRYKR